MNAGNAKGQEEDCQHLALNRAADFFKTHADFLHDGVTCSVLIAFGNLFVVNDEDGCHNKQEADKNTNEEKASVKCIIVV